jgi:hypothetical protein
VQESLNLPGDTSLADRDTDRVRLLDWLADMRPVNLSDADMTKIEQLRGV